MEEELNRLISFLSHNLKEPIRMVSSYLNLLEEKNKGKLDKESLECIEHAISGSNRMEAIISNLLEYSTLDQKNNKKLVNIFSETVIPALNNLHPYIKDKNAIIEFSEDFSMYDLYCDPIQITQVWQNLISNALKYSKKPQIFIRATHIIDLGKPCLLFCVKDNGIGIKDEDLPKLFVMFQRLHVRDQYPGEGMGLAFCKKIVEQHGGYIWIKSVWGGGTEAFFRLPELEEPPMLISN